MSKITVDRKLLATQRKIEKLISNNDFSKAEELLHREYSKHKSHKDFGYINLLTLGRLNMQLDRKDRAEQFLFQAIDVDDTNPEAPKFLTQVYLETKQFHAAIRIIDLLLQIDKECFDYRYWKILALCSIPERSNEILDDWRNIERDFPELKQVALDQYKYWEPDTVIVEAKASGLPLTHELRNMGIPVVNFTPSKGNDKVTRVHSVSPLFEAGMVWAPDTVFADEMIEEVAAFPNGEHDDLVDSMTQALMRYRQGNFVQLPSDDWDDEDTNVKVRAYY